MSQFESIGNGFALKKIVTKPKIWDNESIWKHRKRICFEKKCQKTKNLLRNTFPI